MTRPKYTPCLILAGWPLAALALAAWALYSGIPGSEPYFLLGLGAVAACATNAVAVMIAFGGKQ